MYFGRGGISDVPQVVKIPIKILFLQNFIAYMFYWLYTNSLKFSCSDHKYTSSIHPSFSTWLIHPINFLLFFIRSSTFFCHQATKTTEAIVYIIIFLQKD